MVDHVKVRRESMRWNLINTLDKARPHTSSEQFLLDVMRAIYPDATALEVRRELDYLANGDKHHVRFDDGAEMEYDRASHQLTIKGGIQKVVVEVGAEIVLKAATKVTIDAPNTETTGHLTVGGGLSVQGQGAATATTIAGSVQVDGNVAATGTIMDGGGNSNHHSH